MSERLQLWQLRARQAAPLSLKIQLTKSRIRAWVDRFGEDGVYISFSGGKDSTVLLTIARDMYPNIPAVFSDTGLEYPEIREFVKTFGSVEWLKPSMTFKEVLKRHGYPFIGKEVSERVYYAQRYLTWWKERNSIIRPTDRPTDRPPSAYCVNRFIGISQDAEIPEEIKNEILSDYVDSGGKGTVKIAQLLGKQKWNGKVSQYDFKRWGFLATCPYKIGAGCCSVMKKGPMKKYAKKTGRVPITAQMAEESRLRTEKWLQNGCNAYNLKNPISNPMSFWTEQDVLLFIRNNNLKIASVYGEIIKKKEIPGQMDLDDFGIDMGLPLLTTTGAKRTGCMFCGYGAHLEKPGEGRFERMKITHPKQYEWIMKPTEQGGLGYKAVIDWINEHGGTDIRY